MALDSPAELVSFAESLGLSIGDPDDRGSVLLTRLLSFATGFRYQRQ